MNTPIKSLIFSLLLFISTNVFCQNRALYGNIVNTVNVFDKKAYTLYNSKEVELGKLSFSKNANGRVDVHFETNVVKKQGTIYRKDNEKIVSSAKFNQYWDEELPTNILWDIITECLTMTFDDPECGGFSFHFGCRGIAVPYGSITILF